MPRSFLPSLLLAGLLAAPAAAADFEAECTVSLRGTLYRQNIRNGKLSLLKTSVSTKDILRILEIELGRDFGRGAELVVRQQFEEDVNGDYLTSVDDWTWFVTSTEVVIDVSEYFLYVRSENFAISEGKGKSTSRTYYETDKIFIGTETLFFDFQGLAKFSENSTTVRVDGVKATAYPQSTELRSSSGEALLYQPRQIWPFDGSFSIGRCRIVSTS